MKKLFRDLALCALALVLCVCLLPRRAYAAGTTLSGNSTVKPGDTITLTLSVSGKICGLSATLSCGSGLTMTNYACADSALQLTANGNNFAAYGTTLTTGRIITVTLKADSSLKPGTALSAAFSNVTITDGDNETNLGTASWSGTVADKPSNVCHLTAIRCSNATFSPAFSKDTTYYSANVPYSVSKLSMDYDRADKNSKVVISGTELSVGVNTITITVTAADGVTTKTYTLSVTRQQDPNYKPSSDATLKELRLDTGTLSPAFTPACTEYVAYVPFETREVTLSGTANDAKAVTGGEKTFPITQEGANDVTFTCTAEDGTTTQTYTVHVFRMPVYTGILPVVTVPDAPDTDPDQAPEDAAEPLRLPAKVKLPLVGEASTLLVGGITAGLVAVLLFLLGFLLGRGGDDREEPDEPVELPPRRHPAPPADRRTAEEPRRERPRPQQPASHPAPAPAPQRPAPAAPRREEEKRAAEKAESMSLDELLKDIRDM